MKSTINLALIQFESILGDPAASRAKAEPMIREAAENGEVEDKLCLVDDRNTGHSFSAETTDHNVVEQGNKTCNCLLDDHRDEQHHQLVIERSVTNVVLFEFFEQSCPSGFVYLCNTFLLDPMQ